MKTALVASLSLFVKLHHVYSFRLGGSLIKSRRVRQEKYYYSTSSDDVLGSLNPIAAAGNPLKGLLGNLDFNNFDWSASSIDASMEYYYVGLDEMMIGNPDVVGMDAAFNWTAMENRLNGAASRNRHVVMSVICHYPGRPLNVPQYLLDANLRLLYYSDFLGGGDSPDYSDPILLNALKQFIQAFGSRYDGDHRIGYLQAGLLGFWVRKLVPIIDELG